MADKTVTIWSRDGNNDVKVKYLDNGDGTYSLSVVDGGGGAFTGLTDAQLRTTALSVLLPASELHLGMISGQGDSIHLEFSRPNDTTPYIAKDVVGPTGAAALLTFANIARVNGGSFYVVKARLMTNQAANIAGYRLHLYQDSTPTPIADNAQFALLWANRAVRCGFIDFDGCATEGTDSDSAFSLNKDIRLHMKCAAGSRNIYGVLETTSVFTPAGNQQFFLDLSVEQD